LGNYLGAIRNWVDLQHKAEQVLYCVVDLHSLTVHQCPHTIKRNILDMAIALMACGVDPDKSILFQQSKIPQHAELAWILGCRTPVGMLERMTQWKTKKSQGDNEVGHLGLLSYPILMAADILLYRTSHVPVGDDQLQHLELTRHIARTFNNAYRTDIFLEPKPILGEVTRVMSLRDPTKKMSKSDWSPNSRIELTDSDDLISRKLRRAVTDTTNLVSYNPDERPGVSNLVSIYGALTSQTPDDVCQLMEGKDTAHFKSELVDCVSAVVSPIRRKILELQQDQEFVIQILDEGWLKVADLANNSLTNVKFLVGI
jgi:tryptophanyl-tRNA synthetase